jgi:hypothetical protein
MYKLTNTKDNMRLYSVNMWKILRHCHTLSRAGDIEKVVYLMLKNKTCDLMFPHICGLAMKSTGVWEAFPLPHITRNQTISF